MWNVHSEHVNDLIVGIMPKLYLPYCIVRVAGMLGVLSFFPPVWRRGEGGGKGINKRDLIKRFNTSGRRGEQSFHYKVLKVHQV